MLEKYSTPVNEIQIHVTICIEEDRDSFNSLMVIWWDLWWVQTGFIARVNWGCVRSSCRQ